MDEHTHQQQGTVITVPAFRIWLCGTFRVERRVGTTYEVVRTVEWGGSSYPRLLLKALLCRSGRQARREALLELLWPDVDPEQAVHNLNTATSKLRLVLRPTKEQESLLLTENDASMYRLPGQERLWVDADAALDLLQQAEQLERTSKETLALLEEADRYFRQGPFQQEEEGQWVAGRRATVERARYQGRLWLVEAYELQGMPGQAATILSTMLEEDPLDEDILCRLMVLLHQQGMTHQAMRYYQSTCNILSSEGLEPAEATRKLAMSMQNRRYPPFVARDMMELEETSSSPMIPTMGFDPHKHHGSSTDLSGASHHTVPQIISISPQTRAIDTIFAYEKFPISLFHQQGIHSADFLAHAHDEQKQQLGAWLLLSAGNLASLLDAGWSQEDVFHSIDLLLKVVRVMPKDVQLYSRRQLLQLGAAAMLSDIPIPSSKRVSVDDHRALCQAFSDSIAAGWTLFHTASTSQTLAVGQAQLTLVKQNHAVLYPQIRAVFYSSTQNLIGRALHLQERYEEALEAHINAHIASMGTGNPLYVVQCLICQADTYQALGQYSQAIEVIEEALRIISFSADDEEYTRAKVHLLVCWADSSMQMRDHITAQKKLKEAAVFLDHLGSNEEFDKASWLQLAGKNALMAGDPASAIRYCEEALVELPTNWVVRIAGILVPLAIAYARIGERDASLKVARRALPVLETMNASMSNKHFAEYIQKDLLTLFPCDATIRSFVKDVKRQLPHVAAFIG